MNRIIFLPLVVAIFSLNPPLSRESCAIGFDHDDFIIGGLINDKLVVRDHDLTLLRTHPSIPLRRAWILTQAVAWSRSSGRQFTFLTAPGPGYLIRLGRLPRHLIWR
jgi:hypothetical protein